MPRIIPWLLAFVLGLGWFFTVYPEWLPGRQLALDVGLALTPRQRMLRTWAAAGFDSSSLGRQWSAAGQRALDSAESRALPLAELVYFGLGPRAFGYEFTVEAGRALVVEVSPELSAGEPLVELYRRELRSDTLAHRLVEAMPADRDSLRVEVDEATTYVLRVEAPPLATGRVKIAAGTDPQLGTFPVYGATQTSVKSVWGDPRGGGKRRHEGIDIFHPKGTPLVAAHDGLIARVRNRGLGGKQVWLQLPGRGLSLYYAHLDSQYVRPAQLVRAGDTLGTVGNTGNARTTPPHLHFGIYGSRGAVDPLPWVSAPVWPDEFPPPQDSTLVAGGARTKRPTALLSIPAGERKGTRLAAKQYVQLLASCRNWVEVRLPAGERGWVEASGLESLEQPLRETLPESTSGEGYVLYAAAFADRRYPSGVVDGTPRVLAKAGNWRLVATLARPPGWLRIQTPAGGS